MANTQPAPFGELLSSSWALVRERMKVLLPGVIVFAVVMVLTQIPLTALEAQGALPTAENVGIAIIASVVSVFASVIAYLYYLFALTGKDQSMGTILGRTFPRIFPFIWLMILVMVKTFTWLALLGAIVMAYAAGVQNLTLVPVGALLIVAGILLGFIFGPRYMLAPVLWGVEGGSASGAVKRSYDVSKGYWGKILGNTLLLALIFLVIMVGVGIVAGILGGIGGAAAGAVGGSIVAGLVTTFFSQFYNAVLIAFLLKLTATIIVNPRGGSSVSAPAKTPAAPAAPAAPKPVKAAAPAPVASKAPAKKAPSKPAPKKAAPKKKA